MTPALRDIMALVDDLAGAASPEARNIARSLIAFKVAVLTGDDVQEVFATLRDPPRPVLRVVEVPVEDADGLPWVTLP